MNAEIKSGENLLDEATKWVYADEKGVQVFALFGIGDGFVALLFLNIVRSFPSRIAILLYTKVP